MDLIYMNSDLEDIGVLLECELDLAFGDSENNFECTIQAPAHCCEAGYYIYIEGTEYGGIIDSISVDTDTETIKYSGRTWHGILAGNVIEPEAGYDYRIVSGDANQVISDLLTAAGLTDIFAASTAASDIQIVQYPFDRYVDAYKGIRKMLSEFGGKLKIEFRNKKAVLSAVYLNDYSRNDEWDASQVEFSITKNFRPVNHLICLGSGNLKDRHIIHLFADENGGIQPYRTTESPIGDEDYILDKSKQVLFGVDEVAETYDYPSAQTAENYVKLTEQPEDWATSYAAYYQQDDTDQFVSVEGVLQQEGTLLTAQPDNWATRYGNYYSKVEDKFCPVEAVTVNNYRLQEAKPADWEVNYGNYFVYWSDGVTSEYQAVSGATATRYNVQTQKPTDWDTNWKSYFFRIDGGGFVQMSTLSWPEGLLILPWKPKMYYTPQTYTVAPAWDLAQRYTLETFTQAPEWSADTYYSVTDYAVKPPFAKGKYFARHLDHYAEMVAGAVERMKDFYNCDKISIDLDLEDEYDIGDIVGATERTTGIAVWQPITKKIVSIKDDLETTNYEIGVK